MSTIELDNYARLHQLVEGLKPKPATEIDIPIPEKIRLEELLRIGYTEIEAKAILLVENDPELRNSITREVATHLFGSGQHESKSSVIVWKS